MIMTNGLCLNWFIFKSQVKTLEENNETIINGVNIGNPCALPLITQFPHSFDCDLHFLRRSSPNSPLTAEKSSLSSHNQAQKINDAYHGLRTPGKEIAFTAWPKIKSQSQIFRYGQSIFCLPHRPKISYFFDFICLHCVSIVRGEKDAKFQNVA